MAAATLAMTDPLSLLGGFGATANGLSGPSPSGSSADDFDFDLMGDDDDEHFNLASSFDGAQSIQTGSSPAEDDKDDVDGLTKKRARRAPTTAAKRATHNAVERARRESLNGRFMELAAALPNMASVKRPSKNAIVEKAIEHAGHAQQRERHYVAQAESLVSEIDALRARLGMSPRAPLEPLPELAARTFKKKHSAASNASQQMPSPIAPAVPSLAEQPSAAIKQAAQPRSVSPGTVPTAPVDVFSQAQAAFAAKNAASLKAEATIPSAAQHQQRQQQHIQQQQRAVEGLSAFDWATAGAMPFVPPTAQSINFDQMLAMAQFNPAVGLFANANGLAIPHSMSFGHPVHQAPAAYPSLWSSYAHGNPASYLPTVGLA